VTVCTHSTQIVGLQIRMGGAGTDHDFASWTHGHTPRLPCSSLRQFCPLIPHLVPHIIVSLALCWPGCFLGARGCLPIRQRQAYHAHAHPHPHPHPHHHHQFLRVRGGRVSSASATGATFPVKVCTCGQLLPIEQATWLEQTARVLQLGKYYTSPAFLRPLDPTPPSGGKVLRCIVRGRDIRAKWRETLVIFA
jgi:hypothetical protein